MASSLYLLLLMLVMGCSATRDGGITLPPLESWLKKAGEQDVPLSTNDPNLLESWWYHYYSQMNDATNDAAHDQEVASLFFRMNILKIGSDVVLPSLTRNVPKLLPPSLESMLGRMELPRLLSGFGIDPESKLARIIKINSENCNAPPMQGEKMVCISSMESMASFAHSVLKDKKPLKRLASSRTVSSPEHFKIVDVKVVTQKTVVTCHPMAFPYTLYMCHSLHKSVPMKVTLEDDHGNLVVMPAMCHMDTSEFDPSHISFKVLHTKPGTAEMCHWMPISSILWYTSDGKTSDAL